VSVCLLTITFDYRQGDSGPLHNIGNGLITVMAPLQKAVSKVTNPVGDFFSALAHLPSLQSENERLQTELDATRAELIKQTSDQGRANELEELLQIRAALAPTTVGAVVIGGSVSNFEWTITIDKGSSDGVHIGSPVLTSAGDDAEPGLTGALVGSVVRVTPNASEVRLIIDPASRVAGRLRLSGEVGMIEGQGDRDLRMGLLSADASVRLDDIVSTVAWTAGDDANLYPPGIVIGRVARIFQDPSATSKFVTVSPTVDFASLEFVLVVVGEEGS
jgi:rod shape-determining protein MreC